MVMPSGKGTALTGPQKAAILLIALGVEMSTNILKHLKEEEVERLGLHVYSINRVDDDAKSQVLEEALRLSRGARYSATGGPDYLRMVVSQTLGRQKGEELMSRVAGVQKPHAFDFLRDADPEQLVHFIKNEHPQTVALILAHMPPRRAAVVLSSLDDDLQSDVSRRIAAMDRTPPEAIQQVETVLRQKLSLAQTQELSWVGGVPFLVNVLSNVDRGTEKLILTNLDEHDPELANQVRRMMFVFDNLAQLDDRSMQRVMREVDSKDLALSLKGAGDEVKAKVLRNLSSRAAEMLQEEMDLFGPVKVKTVEDAQQRIVAVVRRLEESEEIVIPRGDDDVFV